MMYENIKTATWKTNTVCRNTSSIQDSTQTHRELLGIDLYVDHLAFAFPPMWDTKDDIGQDVRRAMKLIEAKKRGGQNSIRVDHLPDHL